MTSTEAMIYQLKNLKGKPLKKKLEHIFTYFWLPILAVVAILGFTVSYIFHLATVKDPGLTVTCINAYADYSQAETYIAEFARQANIDLDEYEVRLSTDMTIIDENLMDSYETVQVLAAQIAAQDIDVMVLDSQTVCQYIYQDAFIDLTQVLNSEQQAQYEQYYLYMDMAVLREAETRLGEGVECPDPTRPELMAEPVPVALRLPENCRFQQLFYPHKPGEAVVGILSNSLNTNNALSFLDYIMQ